MKQLNLFDDADTVIKAKRTKQEVFEDYDAFVAKFNADAPKTTDDCFTPQPVYEAILEWLKERVGLEGRCIVRPFYPGGDYENYEYPENCVVVDNPPFSILAKIIRFYVNTGIDYFLFAPALTLFSCAPKGDLLARPRRERLPRREKRCVRRIHLCSSCRTEKNG